MTIDSQRRFDELAQVRLALHGPRGGAVHRPGAPDAGAARNPNRKFREQRRRGAITPKQRCQRGLRFGIGAVNAGKRRDFSASTGERGDTRTGWLGREDSNLRMAESKSYNLGRQISPRARPALSTEQTAPDHRPPI